MNENLLEKEIEFKKKSIHSQNLQKKIANKQFKKSLLVVEEQNYKLQTNNENRYLKEKGDFYDNRIESSKYNWFTMVPQVLFEQFKNVGNIYFLVLAILQLIPSISNSGSTPVNFVPLTIVVLVNGIKDVVEDLKRKRADYAENTTKTLIFEQNLASRESNKNNKNISKVSSDGFVESTWEKIKPGDFIKVKKDEVFPCDLLLIYSANPKGVAYVETKSLDGETNLKLKDSVKAPYLRISTLINKDDTNYNWESHDHSKLNRDKETKGVDVIKSHLNSLNMEINCDMPNDKMYAFSGSLLNKKPYSNNIASKIKLSKSFNDEQSVISSQVERVDDDNVNHHHPSVDMRTSRLDSYAYESKTPDKSLNNIINTKDETLSIEYGNLLLRGSVLKQTDFIYAIAIYTGHETKIMKNSLSARSKQSKLAQLMNVYLKSVLVIECSICVFCTIVNLSEMYPFASFVDHLTSKGISDVVIVFFTWLLNLQNIIPISLVVTLEMIKFCQALYIMWDVHLYHRPTCSPCIVQSSSLNEELGQIKHIFSDKTGTLTKNYMQFSCLLAKDKKYGIVESELKEDQNCYEVFSSSVPNVKFYDKYFWRDWGKECPYIDASNSNNSSIINENTLTEEELKERQNDIRNIVFAFALCHTVVAEEETKSKSLNNNSNVNNESNIEEVEKDLIYHASSPDELALVNGAKYFGAKFVDRKEDNTIILDFYGETYKYSLLNVFEFNSDRKRMSVVIKDSEGNIKIITKGADNKIIERLKDYKQGTNDKDKKEDEIIKNIPNHLHFFGNKGLRTLLFAQRNITDYEYASFMDSHNAALTITDSTRQDRIDESYEMLENNLEYIGASAIEDALQDDLVHTLKMLRVAGIKLWMLTGDHPLTAVSIAHSSGLIDETYTPIIISSCDTKEITSKLITIVDSEIEENIVMVITGDTLNYINNPDKKGLYKVFKLAIEKTQCFIGCRVSPKQKAEIVLMIKEANPNECTLAIGDGANDVNMITSADVGIGIQGVEGTQASRASDYSIGQFSFLKRLMFIHGREAYRKNSFAVGYMLWKNFLYVIPNVFYGFVSQFTGVNLYDPVFDALYNLLFTAYPIGWFSTSDKQFQYKILEHLPSMYTPGIYSKYFNKMIFWKWYLYAFLIGGLIYWNCTSVFINAISKDKDMVDFSALGAIIYFNIVLFVNFKLVLSTHSHEFMTVSLQIFSIGSYFVVLFLTSNFVLFQTFGNWPILLSSFTFFWESILIIAVGLLMEYAWRSLNFFIYEVFIRQKSKETLIDGSDQLDTESFADKEDFVRYNERLSKENNYQEFEEETFEEKRKKSLQDKDIIDIKNENKERKSIYNDILINPNEYLERRSYTGFAFDEDKGNSRLIKDKLEDLYTSNHSSKINESNSEANK